MPLSLVRIFPRLESDVLTSAADEPLLPEAASVVLLDPLPEVDDLLLSDPHAAPRRRTAAIMQGASLVRTVSLLIERGLDELQYVGPERCGSRFSARIAPGRVRRPRTRQTWPECVPGTPTWSPAAPPATTWRSRPCTSASRARS